MHSLLCLETKNDEVFEEPAAQLERQIVGVLMGLFHNDWNTLLLARVMELFGKD